MNKNLRKTLLCVLPFLLLSCSSSKTKAITFDEAIAVLDSAHEKDTQESFSLTSYSFKSTINAPSSFQSDLPYISLNVTYLSSPTYLTTIHRITSNSDDTYIISKDTQSATPVYSVAANGGSPVAYDLIKDAYIYNFFELPTFFYNQNSIGFSTSGGLLKTVDPKNQQTNKMTSYNLYSNGSGNLDMTLRGSTLDFSSFFSEVPVINTNVSSIHFSLDSYLIRNVEASYLVSPAQTPGLTSSSNSLKAQKAASSSVQGTSCSITMAFGYGVTL